MLNKNVFPSLQMQKEGTRGLKPATTCFPTHLGSIQNFRAHHQNERVLPDRCLTDDDLLAARYFHIGGDCDVSILKLDSRCHNGDLDGEVHLIQPQNGFVLIRTSHMERPTE